MTNKHFLAVLVLIRHKTDRQIMTNMHKLFKITARRKNTGVKLFWVNGLRRERFSVRRRGHTKRNSFCLVSVRNTDTKS